MGRSTLGPALDRPLVVREVYFLAIRSVSKVSVEVLVVVMVPLMGRVVVVSHTGSLSELRQHSVPADLSMLMYLLSRLQHIVLLSLHRVDHQAVLLVSRAEAEIPFALSWSRSTLLMPVCSLNLDLAHSVLLHHWYMDLPVEGNNACCSRMYLRLAWADFELSAQPGEWIVHYAEEVFGKDLLCQVFPDPESQVEVLVRRLFVQLLSKVVSDFRCAHLEHAKQRDILEHPAALKYSKRAEARKSRCKALEPALGRSYRHNRGTEVARYLGIVVCHLDMVEGPLSWTRLVGGSMNLSC